MIQFSPFLGFLFSLLLSVLQGGVAEVNAPSFPSTLLSQNAPTLTKIQSEVDPSFRRLSPFLNTWIFIAVFVSTSTVTTVLILFALSLQKLQQTEQDLQVLKQETISHLNQKLSEAQPIVNQLQYTLQSSQDKIQRLSPQTRSLITINTEINDLKP